MDTRMIKQPRAGLETRMTAEIIGDDEDLAQRIVGFNVGERGNVAFRVARSRASGQFLPITYPQRSIHPGFLGSALVVQQRFDAMPIRGPAWSRSEGAWHYGPKFVGVVGDDRCSFGTKSLSRGVPQLCVCRQRTPSESRIRRIWLRFTRMPASLAACASASKLHCADPLSSRATIVPSRRVT